MDSLYYGLYENRGFTGLMKTLFFGHRIDYGLMEKNKTEDYLKAVDAAKLELEYAERLFESATDPDLIECAIYQERASKLRLSYLLKKAKENNIKSVDFTAP